MDAVFVFRKIIFTTIVLFSFLGCKPQTGEHYQVVDVSVFESGIQNQNDVQLVDVRTKEEFQSGHIGNAVNIDVNDDNFVEKIGQLDKNKPVYIYCRSGSRSSKAAKQMIEMGFTAIVELEGGILNWETKKGDK